MRDASPRLTLAVGLTSLAAVLALALGRAPSLLAQAALPAKPLTTEERQKLEAKASNLSEAGDQAYQQGDLVKATARIKESLQIREKLYPKDRYPHGHAELAESLNNMGFLLEDQGSYDEARRCYDRALAIFVSLYPNDRFPHGHPDLATSLNNLGALLQHQGKYVEARQYYERALASFQSLYPKDRYPQGHSDLAWTLNNVGSVRARLGLYTDAREYYERAMAMRESLYPKARYPDGHADLANSLNDLGLLLHEQGSYVEARGYYERALAMNESLYPKNRFPQGHPVLAGSLNNLAVLLTDQGSYGASREYYERALAMRESLYPKDRYPKGHSDLALSLNNLGSLLQTQGSYGEARRYLERALATCESLYPKDGYPRGHPHLAYCLHNLGALLTALGSYGKAHEYFERALVMRQSLYPKNEYPQGHRELAQSLNAMGFLLVNQGSPGEARGYFERALAMSQSLCPSDPRSQGDPELALNLNNLGFALAAQGSYGEARRSHERALAICRSLYPKNHYPQGHYDLAMSLTNLGSLLAKQGARGEAADYLRQATDMYQSLSRTSLAATSEAEAMSYLAHLPRARDELISVSLLMPTSDEETYTRIWNGKSAVTQILHDRQAATLVRAGSDPDVGRTVTDWRDARSRLARQILATADGREHAERDRLIKALGSEKERLERKLAAAVPEFARKQGLERSRHGDLLKILPEGTTVLDLLRFSRIEQDPQVKGMKGERRTLSYLGFVLSNGQSLRMVDLGPAAPIDDAVSRWTKAIDQGQDSRAAADLRKLVWEPLAGHLPDGTARVFLAPDGSLCYVPWAALPGDRPGTVLLEQYAVGIIPHAPFLLDRLTAPKAPGEDSSAGLVLAVGGVAYGQSPKPVGDERTRLQLLAARPAETKRGEMNGWVDLPGTLQELDAVSRSAASREILRLQGAQAGTAHLLEELPRARWAHIATHGFFADPSIRSVLTPDSKLFGNIGTERAGAGLRNPLVLSGLVLAGANLPRSGDDLLAHDDRGILTAESIAGLDLSGMDLVVLSACETGLGLGSGGGEGVFGLQRAFQMAGAKNVVASLWKVDDQATAALMTLFYERLWKQSKPPLEALREAQLALYRNPELAGKLAAARGTPDFEKFVQRPETGDGSGGSSTSRRAPARQWAAFVLSGDGR
jgi:CHAT domain-containing protein/tetratricopeptide (TPR) repeat protein